MSSGNEKSQKKPGHSFSLLPVSPVRYTPRVAAKVLGVLGGKDIGDDHLRAWSSSADVVYAADSGADRLIALGFSPVVVGDFDSFSSLPRASHLRLVQSLDDATTDCDKMLALVRSDGHGAITLTGTEGDLPDHVLATYASAVACGLDVRFAFRRGIGVLVRSRTEVATRVGQRVSLVPLTACSAVRLGGVAWEVAGARFEPGGALSVSNEATGDRVVAEVESGAALLFLETREVLW
jgi:thiamine pyrophosphokinase